MVSRYLAGFVLMCAIGSMAGQPVAADERRPLLMEGKKSLYQRVLIKPGSSLSAKPGGDSGSEPLTPFSVFYVYGREGDWLEVGSDRFGKVRGWVPGESALEWNQGLTVAFRDPVDQDRVLLFKDRDSLKSVIESRDMTAYDKLYREAEADQLPEDSHVIAMQPKGYVDVLKDFYLVPIRRHQDVYLGNEQAMMLEVATVPLEGDDNPANQSSQTTPAESKPAEATTVAAAVSDANPAPKAGNPGNKGDAERFRAGVVFVIDATQSMGPYIDRTREAVRNIYNKITEAGLEGDVKFGLVAYRDNVSAVPRLEYLTRTYATLEEGRDAAGFFAKVDEIEAAGVSSKDFVEDGFAGVKQAIEDIKWDDITGRYVVVITDAGARTAGDALGSTGMTSESLNQLARDKGIAVSVLHLLTPMGVSNHQAAKKQYSQLSDYPGIGSLYYGVKTGNVNAFGRVLDALAQQITNQVREMANGGEAPVADAAPVVAATPAPAAEADPQLVELQTKVAKWGNALRMRYLQRTEGGKVPSVFNAWLVDRDIRNPERSTLDVRVLLTRDQLSDLHNVLSQVLESAEEGLLSPRSFLDDLKSLAVTVARDPQELGETTRASGGGNLADLGFMREYVEDLPYVGEVMSLSLEDWQEWPAKQQLEFIHKLEEKINYYQVLHDHTDFWVSLDGGPVSGDSVFPIALDMLP